MRKGATQYLILMIWRPCDLNLVMIASLVSKARSFKMAKLRSLQSHFIKWLRNGNPNLSLGREATTTIYAVWFCWFGEHLNMGIILSFVHLKWDKFLRIRFKKMKWSWPATLKLVRIWLPNPNIKGIKCWTCKRPMFVQSFMLLYEKLWKKVYFEIRWSPIILTTPLKNCILWRKQKEKCHPKLCMYNSLKSDEMHHRA